MAKKTASDDGVLVKAAKKIGGAAGKVPSAAGVEAPPADGSKATAPPAAGSAAARTPKKGKLQKKNKARIPRKLKKAQKKAREKAAASRA